MCPQRHIVISMALSATGCDRARPCRKSSSSLGPRIRFRAPLGAFQIQQLYNLSRVSHVPTREQVGETLHVVIRPESRTLCTACPPAYRNRPTTKHERDTGP